MPKGFIQRANLMTKKELKLIRKLLDLSQIEKDVILQSVQVIQTHDGMSGEMLISWGPGKE